MTTHVQGTRMFKALFEASPHAYLVLATDAAFTVVAVNPRYLAATASRREALLGRSVFECAPAADSAQPQRDALRASLERVLRLHRPDTLDAATGSGDRRRRVHTPVIGADGRVHFILQHLEARPRAAARRDDARQRQLLAALIDNSSDFIGLAAPDGTPVYLNPAGRRMVGLPLDRPIQDTRIIDYYPDSEHRFVSDVILKSMHEHGQWKGETFFRHWQTDAAIPVSDEHFKIHDAASGELLGLGTITRDITELRRAQEAAEAANRQLRQANAEITRLYEQTRDLERAKSAFFANVSHELRTPLTLILGPLGDLLGAGGLSAPQRSAVELARRNAQRLLKHVNALLDFSRIEARSAPPQRQPTDLAVFTTDLASQFRAACDRAGLTLIVDCPPLPQPVAIDRGMWEQVVLNLLSNAFKFTLEGRIEVRLRAVGEQVELSVRDTGSGIPADELPKVFERFHRVPTPHARSQEGSGIGLALVRDLVRLHDGEIQATSTEHRGSCFTVRIPLGEPPAAATPAAPVALQHAHAYVDEALHWLPDADSAPAPLAAADANARVFVADDNADMRDYLVRLLTQAGFAVRAFANGDAALAACRSSPPDLLLSDVMMPGLDGFSLLKALRNNETTATLPIILLSARAGGEAMVEGLAAGADDYLVKPFEARELLARVNAALRLAQLRREHADAQQALSHRLEIERARLNDAQAVAHVGSWELDLRSNELWWSDEAYHIFDIEQTAFGATYDAFLGRVHPDDRDAVNRAYRESIATRQPYSIEHRMCRRDGSIRWVQERCRTFYADSGEPLRSIGTVQDITERRQAEELMRQAATVFSATTEGIIVTDPQARISSVNPAFTRITGYARDEVIGRNPSLLASDRHTRDFFQRMWQELASAGHWQGELWNRRKNGEMYPIWENISEVRDDSGRLTHYVAIFTDISESKAAEERLAHLAHHDALTDLPNRVLFTANLDKALDRARRHGRHVGLFLLDLDRFKLINDTLGHAAGDDLLCEVAQRLRHCARAEDTVARLGGDEFAIIVNDLRHPQDATPIAVKIIDAIGQPVLLGGRELRTSASVGIGLFPDDAGNAADLIQAADAAMYRAKAHGRNTYDFYTPELSQIAAEHMEVEGGLRRALADGQFVLHYQPQIEVATGRLAGVEALLRWHHPQRGLLAPEQFVRIAEESGQIEGIGDWVVNAALAQLAQWSAAGLSVPRVAINVSGRQILYDHVAQSVAAAIARHGPLPAGVELELEITESVLLSFDRSARILHHLKACGARIAIDDFGTGYSSLSRLKHLPVDTLKIDRAFVRGLPDAADNRAIVTAIIAMGHSLGLHVVAEGVERREQFEFLRSLGCDEVQGHLFYPALPADAVTALLRQRATPASPLTDAALPARSAAGGRSER